MPGAVAAAASFVAGLVTAAGPVGFISRIVFAQIVGSIADNLLAPDTPGSVGLSGRDVTVRGALEYRKVVYGTGRVSGPNAYPNLSGANGEDLWFFIPLHQGRAESVEAIWIDDVRIATSDINWTPGVGSADGTGDGAVTDPAWVGTNSATSVFCYWYLGYDDQPANAAALAAFPQLDSNFRGRGFAHMAVRCRYTEETKSVWEDKPQPQNIRAEVKGALVYDSRLDSTNGGTGTHRYDDETTWEWSENPQLCKAHYQVKFQNVDPAIGINWPSSVIAADACEVSVSVPSATQDRFTCNGALSLGSTHIENIEDLQSSMLGKWTYSNGQFHSRASIWEASSESFTTDDLDGPITGRGSRPTTSRWNVVRGFYVDPDRNFEAAEFQHITTAEFATRDNNEPLYKDIQLPFTNNEFMAQRIAYRVLEQGDNQESFSSTLNPVGLKVIPGDVVDWTISELSYSGKEFRVTNWKPTPKGGYELSFEEDSSDRYTDPLVGEYVTTTDGQINVPTIVVAPPSNLVATSIENGIRLTWDNPAGRLYESVNIYASTTEDWASAVLVASPKTNFIDLYYGAGEIRYFWIRTVNFEGTESLRFPDNDISTVVQTSGVVGIDLPCVTETPAGNVAQASGSGTKTTRVQIGESCIFTANPNIGSTCLVTWAIDGNISAATDAGGTATGLSYLEVIITIDGVSIPASGSTDNRIKSIEPHLNSSGEWTLFTGSINVDIGPGQTLEVSLYGRRTFSVTGTFSAITQYHQNTLITINSVRADVDAQAPTPPETTVAEPTGTDTPMLIEDAGSDPNPISHTVPADATLLVCYLSYEAGESITDVQFDGVSMTLIRESDPGTASNGDIRLRSYGLVDPPEGTFDADITWSGSASPMAALWRSYKGTPTTSVADATNYISEVFNTSVSQTTVLASGGTAGNLLVAWGGAMGGDMSPGVFTNLAQVYDGETGPLASDMSLSIAESSSVIPSGETITWDKSDENSGQLIEIVSASTPAPPVVIPDVTAGPDFPRLGIYLIGERNYMNRDSDGDDLRDALTYMDNVVVGLFANGNWDANGGAGTASVYGRAEFIQWWHDNKENPDAIMTDYFDVMETSRDGSSADKYYDEDGPIGAEAFWDTHAGERTPPPTGTSVNDWFARQGDGEQKSTFGAGDIVNTNNTNYVQPDALGRRVPEYYADTKMAVHFDPITTISKDVNGIGGYMDVMDIRPKSSTIDFNGDGSNDSARSDWDTPGSIGQESANRWRQGQVDCINRFKASYPNMLWIANGVTYNDENGNSDMSTIIDFQAEYAGVVDGAIAEGASLNVGQFPQSGVFSDGSDSQPGFGSWQLALNNYVCLCRGSNTEQYNMNDWHVDVTPTRSTNPTSAPWDLVRWAIAMTLMHNGCVAITRRGNRGTVPLFDEYGVVNTGTTGLSKGWLGQPIDPPQTSARADGAWVREFDNGAAIANPDNDGSNSALSVDISDHIGSGVYRLIIGSQDGTTNDGSTISADFNLNPKDARIVILSSNRLGKFSSRDISDSVADPLNASVGIRIDSDGLVYVAIGDGASYSSVETWFGTGATSQFEVFVTVASGSDPTGTLDTWLSLGSDQTFELSQSSLGSVTSELTITIRRTSDNREFAPRTINLTAEVTM